MARLSFIVFIVAILVSIVVATPLDQRTSGTSGAAAQCSYCYTNCGSCKAKRSEIDLESRQDVSGEHWNQCSYCVPRCCTGCNTVLTTTRTVQTSCGLANPDTTVLLTKPTTITNTLLRVLKFTKSVTQTFSLTETLAYLQVPTPTIRETVTVTSLAPTRTTSIETIVTIGTSVVTSYSVSVIPPSAVTRTSTVNHQVQKDVTTSVAVYSQVKVIKYKTITSTYPPIDVGLPQISHVTEVQSSQITSETVITDTIASKTTTLTIVLPTSYTTQVTKTCAVITVPVTTTYTFGQVVATSTFWSVSYAPTTIYTTSTVTLSKSLCPVKRDYEESTPLKVERSIDQSLEKRSSCPDLNPKCVWCLNNCCTKSRTSGGSGWQNCNYCRSKGCCALKLTTKTKTSTCPGLNKRALITRTIPQFVTTQILRTTSITTTTSFSETVTTTTIDVVAIGPPIQVLPSTVVSVETPTETVTSIFVTNGVTTTTLSFNIGQPTTRTAIAMTTQYSTITNTIYRYITKAKSTTYFLTSTAWVPPPILSSNYPESPITVTQFESSNTVVTQTVDGTATTRTFTVVRPTGTTISTSTQVCLKTVTKKEITTTPLTVSTSGTTVKPGASKTVHVTLTSTEYIYPPTCTTKICNAPSLRPQICQNLAAGKGAIANGNFETVSPGYPRPENDYRLVFDVVGWKTTASDGLIEIWSDKFYNIPADSAQYFAELNANEASTLYQDISVVPGERIYWSLKHRGRNGEDVMEVDINSVTQRTIRDSQSWGFHEGAYIVPNGVTTARFAFRAVSAAGGDVKQGNFLDSIRFQTPATACDHTINDAEGGSPVWFDPLAYNVGSAILPAKITAKIAAPSHGTLQVLSNNTLKYTPNPGFTGTETIKYTITDAVGCVSTATLTVHVKSQTTSTTTTRTTTTTRSTTSTTTSTTLCNPPDVIPDICDNLVGGQATIVNGNFDTSSPGYPAASSSYYAFVSDMIGWKTTASDGLFEVWASGFEGVPANSPSWFVELNAAAEASMLYQDVAVVPGERIHWSLKHRSRATGNPEVMSVEIGPPGNMVRQGEYSVQEHAWVTHEGGYLVPPGVTSVRFGFNAVRGTSGDITKGNFLDSITFRTPATACNRTVTCNSGTTCTYDPLALTNGSGIAPVQVTAVPIGLAIGTVTVVNNKIQFTPNASVAAGTQVVKVTISDALSCTSTAYVTFTVV